MIKLNTFFVLIMIILLVALFYYNFFVLEKLTLNFFLATFGLSISIINSILIRNKLKNKNK
jgi:hypothetical protein